MKVIEAIERRLYGYLRKRLGLSKDFNQLTNRRRKKYNGLYVSDHALLRYFERVEGYDLDGVSNLISNGASISGGLDKQVVGDLKLVIDNDTVITLYKNDYKTGNSIKGFESLTRQP